MGPQQGQFEPEAERQFRAANSLFRRILALSPFDPRFYQGRTGYPLANYNRIKILAKDAKKNAIWLKAFRLAPRRPQTLNPDC